MAITGENVKEFVMRYIDVLNQEYSGILNKKIIDTESKHIPAINGSTLHLHRLSQNVGYKFDIIGSHRESNLESEMQRINNMKNAQCPRAARFVLTSDGRIWADNTHWTIAYIFKYGQNTTIADIPSYLVDFRYDIPIILDYGNVVFDSIFCIRSAIACAERIETRLRKGWRGKDISYTINNLIKGLYNNSQD